MEALDDPESRDEVVLIVEDESHALKILEAHVRRMGFGHVSAANGQEALKALRANTGIRLVVSDIMMPFVNGLELFKQMKADARLKDIPVVFASGRSDATCVRTAVSMGCLAYLIKPIAFAKLKEQVLKVMGPSRKPSEPLSPDELDDILRAF